MQPWTGNLIGLAIGSAIAGVCLFLLVAGSPSSEQTAVADPIAPSFPPDHPRSDQAGLRPGRWEPAAEPPPVTIGSIRASVLPNVIYPDPPGSGSGAGTGAGAGANPRRGERGAALAGTGFFVGADGSLITAAHVVTKCKQVRVLSKFVKPASAELVASDAKQDIALLRAVNVHPPAILAIGRPSPASKRLFVLGYPANGGLVVASETWGTLENPRLPPGDTGLTDPRNMIWLEAPEIGHGYSGGPILDPNTGEVVGIVRAGVDSAVLHAAATQIPAAGMVVGPGSAALRQFLRNESDYAEASFAETSAEEDDRLTAARRATVHVFCMF